jgi:SAM-dependent methyltransferase
MKNNYWHCENCQFISKAHNELITEAQERVIYDIHQNFIGDEKYEAYFRKFIKKTLVPFLKPNMQGLDFGSGPEPVLATLFEREYNVTMDIYDLFYAPNESYLSKQYDFIVCTEVIEHLQNPLAYFNLFKARLKENGVLAIMTQFHNNQTEDFINWHYTRDRSHISFYTPQTFAVIAKLVGLEILLHDNQKCIAFKRKINL